MAAAGSDTENRNNNARQDVDSGTGSSMGAYGFSDYQTVYIVKILSPSGICRQNRVVFNL